jgi:hypothetical protein
MEIGNMKYLRLVLTIGIVSITFSESRTFGQVLDRAAIAAHLDEIQNVVVKYHESRTYNIDSEVAAKAPVQFSKTNEDLNRKENSTAVFEYLNGNARFDRTTDEITLKYWAKKGMPAIFRQTQTISSTGKVEELTEQILKSGAHISFGGIRQLNAFAPDVAVDVAMGLRLLGSRQWLSRDDLNIMHDGRSADSNIVVLEYSDGKGHTHELHFDKQLLYALVYYRCTSSNKSFVEISNSDFHRQGNIFFPGTIVRTSTILDANGKSRHPLDFTYTIDEASVNDPSNQLSLYVMSWPARLQLFDERINDRIEVGPATRPMTDDDIRVQIAGKKQQQITLEDQVRQRMNHVMNNPPSTRP